MNKLQFLIDWYNREEERKSAVENSLNIPIGILTLMFAVQFFLIKDFDFNGCKDWEKICFLGFVILSTLSSLGAVYYVFKSYHNFPNEYKYGGIPYPTELLKHEQELIRFYKENANDFEGESGEQKFNEYLQNKLAEHIDTNSFNNDEKYRFLNISKRLIFLAIVSTVIGFIPFLTNFFSRPAKAQQIEIINIKEVNTRLEIMENHKIKSKEK